MKVGAVFHEDPVRKNLLHLHSVSISPDLLACLIAFIPKEKGMGLGVDELHKRKLWKVRTSLNQLPDSLGLFRKLRQGLKINL